MLFGGEEKANAGLVLINYNEPAKAKCGQRVRLEIVPCPSSLCLMAQMVRDREISPVELIQTHLRQIQEANPKLNAFVVVMAEEALAAARQAEAAVVRGDSLGLLHGVPISVKDSFDVAGLPTLSGSRFRLGHRAEADA